MLKRIVEIITLKHLWTEGTVSPAKPSRPVARHG